MKEQFEKILNEYIYAKKQPLSGHPMGIFFRQELPEVFYKTKLLPNSQYKVTGSVGQGRWADVPWLCIFDRRITTSAMHGVYIVYLLSKDGQNLYLTLIQGCTDIRSKHTKTETINILHKQAKLISSKINSRGFSADQNIDLGNIISERAELYKNGTIYYKKYSKHNIPDDEILLNDLKNILAIYKDYYNYFVASSSNIELPEDDKPEEKIEDKLNMKESINQIKKYIANKGFTYEDGLIENFYLSLKSKPFVILAGTSGTGKTRLVRLFAESVGATIKNGRYKMIPVRPDWSDSSDLFGHIDLNGNFVPGILIDFVKAAQNDIDKPYFLCLDEMNLARVEYYLSDILSVIETRTFDNKIIITDSLIPETFYGKDVNALEKYGDIIFPENLYIIGTVNMDETTFPFSKKVLDRANTIEFSNVDLIPKVNKTDETIEPLNLDNSYFKSDYLLLTDCFNQMDLVKKYCDELQNINVILEKANAQFGYRVRDEIIFYLINNHDDKLLPGNLAFDYEIMQKVLPRIQGNSNFIKELLCELFKICAGDYKDYQVENNQISAQMFRVIKNENCKYLNCAKKIAFMVRRFEEDGFTSFWF